MTSVAGTNKTGKVMKMLRALRQRASLALPRFLQGVFNHTAAWGQDSSASLSLLIFRVWAKSAAPGGRLQTHPYELELGQVKLTPG